jgi:hypothetical protein
LVDAVQTYDSVLEKFERWMEIDARLLEVDKKIADSKKPMAMHAREKTLNSIQGIIQNMSLGVSGKTSALLFLISLLLSLIFGYVTLYYFSRGAMVMDWELTSIMGVVSFYFIAPSLILTLILHGVSRILSREHES